MAKPREPQHPPTDEELARQREWAEAEFGQRYGKTDDVFEAYWQQVADKNTTKTAIV